MKSDATMNDLARRGLERAGSFQSAQSRRWKSWTELWPRYCGGKALYENNVWVSSERHGVR